VSSTRISGDPPKDSETPSRDIYEYLKDRLLWIGPGFYLLVSGLGFLYETVYLNELGINFLDYASTEDFLIAALRRPEIIGYSLIIGTLFLLSSLNYWDAVAEKEIPKADPDPYGIQAQKAAIFTAVSKITLQRVESFWDPLIKLYPYSKHILLIGFKVYLWHLRTILKYISKFIDEISHKPALILLTGIFVISGLVIFSAIAKGESVQGQKRKFLDGQTADNISSSVVKDTKIGAFLPLPAWISSNIPRPIVDVTTRWSPENISKTKKRLILVSVTKDFAMFLPIDTEEPIIIPTTNISEIGIGGLTTTTIEPQVDNLILEHLQSSIRKIATDVSELKAQIAHLHPTSGFTSTNGSQSNGDSETHHAKMLEITKLIEGRLGQVAKSTAETSNALGQHLQEEISALRRLSDQAAPLPKEIKGVARTLLLFEGQVDEFRRNILTFSELIGELKVLKRNAATDHANTAKSLTKVEELGAEQRVLTESVRASRSTISSVLSRVVEIFEADRAWQFTANERADAHEQDNYNLYQALVAIRNDINVSPKFDADDLSLLHSPIEARDGRNRKGGCI